MTVFAIDNEWLALKLLCDTVREVAPDAELYSFQNPFDLLKATETTKCDIAFLDIELRQMSGLQVAKKLKAKNPELNLIFVTEQAQYAVEAWEMMASGYVIKPITSEILREQFGNLRYPIKKQNVRIFARTFGNFELNVNNKTLHFHRRKSKELLAYLIHRKGEPISRKELSLILFNDAEFSRNRQAYLSIIAHDLEEDLKEAGAESIFVRQPNAYLADTTQFTCDAYESKLEKLPDEYMIQYSWRHNN